MRGKNWKEALSCILVYSKKICHKVLLAPVGISGTPSWEPQAETFIRSLILPEGFYASSQIIPTRIIFFLRECFNILRNIYRLTTGESFNPSGASENSGIWNWTPAEKCMNPPAALMNDSCQSQNTSPSNKQLGSKHSLHKYANTLSYTKSVAHCRIHEFVTWKMCFQMRWCEQQRRCHHGYQLRLPVNTGSDKVKGKTDGQLNYRKAGVKK